MHCRIAVAGVTVGISCHQPICWCRLLEEHRPAEVLEARLFVFRKRPSSSSAARLHKAAGKPWPECCDEVLATLAASPSDAVLFALLTLKEPELAWNLAHSLALDSDHTWAELAKGYEKVDPLAVLPIHQRLVENELVEPGAQHYRLAARRLVRMRKLVAAPNKPPRSMPWSPSTVTPTDADLGCIRSSSSTELDCREAGPLP